MQVLWAGQAAPPGSGRATPGKEEKTETDRSWKPNVTSCLETPAVPPEACMRALNSSCALTSVLNFPRRHRLKHSVSPDNIRFPTDVTSCCDLNKHLTERRGLASAEGWPRPSDFQPCALFHQKPHDDSSGVTVHTFRSCLYERTKIHFLKGVMSDAGEKGSRE